MKKLVVLFLPLILFACTLNSEQEAALQKAVSSYVEARNNGVLMTFVSLTHPNAVAHYKAQGDEAFKRRFDLVEGESALFLQDGYLKSIETEGKRIHAKYEYLGIDESYLDEMNTVQAKDVFIYAISNDEGKSWFFIEGKDYKNDEIIAPKDRLLK